MAAMANDNAKKELILQALTDPKFRRLLEKEPSRALKISKLTEVQLTEVAMILEVVKGIDQQIAGMADKLLCNNGGCRVVA
jgi:hypothetical protein